jgi:hypothetical protein
MREVGQGRAFCARPANRVIFNPKGKTLEARRSVPMSDRVLDLLMTR